MAARVIAIGNILMGDDYIGVKVAQMIMPALKRMKIDIIIGETDIDYCLSMVEENDYIIILSAACYGKRPGSITATSLEGYCFNMKHSAHELSLPKLLLLNFKSIHGLVIGIETAQMLSDPGLSMEMRQNLDAIAQKVLNIIADAAGKTTSHY